MTAPSTQTFTQTRDQLHRAIHHMLMKSGMSTNSARVTADGYLHDLERTRSLKLRGLGQVRRAGPESYEVTPEPLGAARLARPQFDGRPEQADAADEAAFEQATRAFMAGGTPEALARSAANIVVNFRQGKRVD